MPTLSKRTWILTTGAWFLLAFLQAPGLISADTKLDLTSDPWGFLAQALYPWTDTFPLGQLQNQAYGYLFPHGLFFALLSWLPGWITQRLWWGLLLTLAFAGTVKLLETAALGSRSSRVIAGVLFALSPRVLTTLGAISSEAWTMALVPWVLLPVVRAFAQVDAHSAGSSRPILGKSLRTRLAWSALCSSVAILCLGAVNAVATVAATIPAFLWFLAVIVGGRSGVASNNKKNRTADRGHRRLTRRAAAYFALWWIPSGILAAFWWIGPLLLLGRFSPPFTDYIESSSLTTRWLNPLEVLRGTTSWTPFLSAERAGGHALVTEPVFVVATLVVALLGLWGMRRLPLRWWMIFGVGFLAMVAAIDQFSPISEAYRAFLDGPGAALRNLHKFDPLVRLPLVAGVAIALEGVQWPGLSRKRWRRWQHPEKHPAVPQAIAVALLLAIVTATGWSGRIPAADTYRSVPSFWTDATQWLNDHARGGGERNQAAPARTMILPEARFGRQTWGNTRDEPAQPWLDVPWVVRDSVPLVQPEAIRGLDGVQREVHSGEAIPSLAATLRNQGVGFVLLRSDLTVAADTPGPKAVLKTLERSGGFREVAAFGDEDQVRIFRVEVPGAPSGGDRGHSSGDHHGEDGQRTGAAPTANSSLRMVNAEDVEVVHAGPEALPRLDAADAALGRRGEARTRVLDMQIPKYLQSPAHPDPSSTPHQRGNTPNAEPAADPLFGPTQTVTDTPALREHNYGNVVNSDSEIRAPGDPSSLLNPVKDYPVRAGNISQRASGAPAPENSLEPLTAEAMTKVRETRGHVVASSSASDPAAFGGASTISSPTAAVDKVKETAWRPAPGVAPGQWIEFRLDSPVTRPVLMIRPQGAPTRLQVTTTLGGKTVASTTASTSRNKETKVTVPAGKADAIRLTIISAYGDFGLAEATVTENDKDLTPRRIVSVPAAADASRPNRFVFGQEIPESPMIREFTVPGPAGSRTPYVIHTDRCNSAEPARVTIDDRRYQCGDVIQLPAGTHVLRSHDRWAALSIAEPLYAAAIGKAPGGQPVGVTTQEKHSAPGSQTVSIAPSDKDRIIYSPSQANPGRQARMAGASVNLTPITVNGWQQGWIVPKGTGRELTIQFAPTALYRAWLAVGLGAGLLLLGLWGWLGLSMRRYGVRASLGPTPRPTPQPSQPIGRGEKLLTRATTALFGVSSALAVFLAARGPWGSGTYAGDQLATRAAVGVAVACALLRCLHHALMRRRAGSSTSE